MAALVGLLLPMLYVFGYGPALMVYRDARSAGRTEQAELLKDAYAPLVWVGKHVPPVKDALRWYERLWR